MKVPAIESLNTGSKRGELYIKKQFPEFYESLLKDDRRFPEILYAYYYGPAPQCPVCGKPTTFLSFSKGYSKYCSSKCANNDPEKKLKSEQTCLKKYGTRISSQSEEVRQKASRTCIERYGVDYHKQQLEKRKTTNLQKYGVEHGLSSPIVREKIKQTCLERYGVENILLIPGQTDKLKAGVMAKYGVENVMYSEELRNKVKQTCLERYGVEYPFKSPDIQKKCHVHDTNIERFIEDILIRHEIEYIREDHNILPGARVDFHLPQYKLIIEANGAYWHSDKHKSPKYHLKRTQAAQCVGYCMLIFWEDQIYRTPQVVESIILSKLGRYLTRIGARQCIIKEIDGGVCNEFLEVNHIQGRTNSKVKLGAYFGDELIGVMTFIQSRGCQGANKTIEGQWELNRFCTKLNTQVIGLASKMLNHFIINYQPKTIISFSHNDISIGDVYGKLGFVRDGVPRTSYYYIKGKKRFHRSNFTRAGINRRWPEYDLNDKSWTERMVMDSKNYDRIYDCGTQKWIKKILP